jgi:protein-S-isoprenylcysteine O-methyltransferase Ste14
MFGLAVLSLNAVQLGISEAVGDHYLAVHAACWALWFGWQGWVFPRARERYLSSGVPRPYATAYYAQIWPGVSAGVSQMTLPVVATLLHARVPAPAPAGLGLAIAALGVAMLWTGFRTIGIAQAGFVTEYRQVQTPMVCRSIYSVLRHPLFVGGALVSFGGVLLLGGGAGEQELAITKLLILPVYRSIEDRRLARVFGAEYAKYSAAVGGVLPRPRQLFQMAWEVAASRRLAREA